MVHTCPAGTFATNMRANAKVSFEKKVYNGPWPCAIYWLRKMILKQLRDTGEGVSNHKRLRKVAMVGFASLTTV